MSELQLEDQVEEACRETCYGTPQPIIAQFYWHAVKDKAASDAQNVPIYTEKPFVMIKRRQERDFISFEVTEEHKERWPREWQEFQTRAQRQIIPLTALPKFRPAIRLAFEELNIRDVDTLLASAVPDYLKPWQAWAREIKAIHDNTNKPPPANVTPIEKAKPRGRPRKSHAEHASNQPQSSIG